MARNTKSLSPTQVTRLRKALEREKAKGAALAKSRTEALEQQAAAAEILKVISRSPSNAQPVFDAIVERALRLMDGHSAIVTRVVDGMLHLAALTSTSRAGDAALRKFYPRPIVHYRQALLRSRRPVVVVDTEKLPKPLAGAKELSRARGYRSMVVVPMLRDRTAIGTISVTRKEPGPFSKHQIDLLKTFAAQAVIAIENVRLFNETKEALERQTATAEILKVISGSPTDINPVFEAIASSAARLCEASFCIVFRFDGTMINVAADDGRSPGTLDIIRSAYPAPPGTQSFSARAILERRVISIADAQNMPDDPQQAERARAIGYRSILAVPMVKGDAAIGTINVARLEVKPFTDAQVELLKTFADQAVIAIENVRLFNETREALERQTATADILKVIASSPSDVRPVFDAIARSAVAICAGLGANVFRYDGELLHFVSGYNTTGEQASLMAEKYPMRPDVSQLAGRAILSKSVIRMEDARADPDYDQRFALAGGWRRVLGVPMLREGTPIGAIVVRWVEPGPISSAQEELLQTFADQAVIAIENARLFTETKEALERQTATGDILASISGSMTDTKPVFAAMVRNLLRLFGTRFAVVQLLRDGIVEVPAVDGEPGFERLIENYPRPLDETTMGGRAMLSKQTVRYAPVIGNPEAPEAFQQFARDFGFNSVIAAPMIREGIVVGAIATAHREAHAFDDQQVALLRTFADQAVIAIENVRLFNETKEALERQTATAEILKVIAGSPTDVQPVFEVIVQSAVRLCGARFGRVYRYDGSIIEMVAGHGLSSHGMKQVRQVFPRAASDDTIVGRVILTRQPFFLKDIQADESVPDLSRKMIEALDTRSQVTVPMLRAGESIGAITLGWDAPGAFDDQQVALLQTFADQAVIAIENVRLFNETKEALERQTAIGEILRVISSSPADVQPVLLAVAERAARICTAQFVDIVLAQRDVMRVGAAVGDLGRPIGEAVPLDRTTVMGRSIVDRTPVHVADLQNAGDDFPLGQQLALKYGHRTILAVPLVREDRALGTILVRRTDVRPFADKDVAVLKTFADQAAIAIENVRLFNETKDALERQTATGEILRVIASSPTEVQPVFDAIVSSAARLFNRRASLRLVEQGGIRRRARSESAANDSPDVLPIDHESLAGRVILDTVAQQVTDTLGPDAPPYAKANAHKWDFRANAAAPLIRDGAAIGLISVASPHPGALSDKQMALLATFADQAVIAIENVRLFNETKEALEQQTAISEILRVMSDSPADVLPILDAVVDRSMRICESTDARIFVVDGDKLRYATGRGDVVSDWIGLTRPITRGLVIGRAVIDRVPVHVEDLASASETEFPVAKEVQRVFGHRTTLAVPLLREGRALGVILLRRNEVRPFTQKQISLLKTFGDQAAIAIENVRLFTETKEALERQTATAEVLRVISNSPTDTQPVFEAIAQSGLRLFPGAAVAVALPEGDHVRAAAIATQDPELAAAWRARFPVPFRRDQMHGAAILDRRLIDVPDAEAEVDGPMGPGVRNFLKSGNKAITIVPMIRGESAIGAISVIRLVPGPLKPNQVALLQTFADQAVIAIENVRLFNETKEALEQQTATAGILGVISSSPTSVQPVFESILEHALRLCEANFGYVCTSDGNAFDLAVQRGLEDPVRAEALKAFHETRVPGSNTALGRLRETKRSVHILDATEEAAYSAKDPRRVAIVELAGARTMLAMPLLREGDVIGAVVIYRREVKAFTDKQMDLLRTFAAQAVIAIENVRLFNETKESLERQTATAEILKVIASSPSDVQPVFDAIAASARRLLGGHAALVARRVGEVLELAAFTSTGETGDSELSRLWPSKITGKGHMGKALMSAAPAWVEDIETDPSYSEEFRVGARARGMRSAVSVPMLREGEAIGVISVNRSISGRFSDHQTNLLKTFADQAMIAIENVRLFNETKEALERQTATGEILKAIASSPSDVQPVFDQILHSCQRLFEGLQIGLTLAGEDGRIHLGAYQGANREHLEQVYPYPLGRDSGSGQAMLDRKVVQFADIGARGSDAPPRVLQGAQAAGVKSLIFAPLIAEGRSIGALWVGRRLPGPFDDDQAALLKTFADQAVIAIENVRLFNETKEALERQTATAEILKVISSSPTDVQPVFDIIGERAQKLCDAHVSVVSMVEGELIHLVSLHGVNEAGIAAMHAAYPMRQDGETVTARAVRTRSIVHLPDVFDDPRYGQKDTARTSGFRSALGVPMVRDGQVIGIIFVARAQAGRFTSVEIDLLQTFADQAVIAIENVRLFKELEARTQALGRSVRQLTALGEVGQAISSTLDLETVLKAIATRAVQLTGLDGASIYEYDEQTEEFRLQAAHNLDEVVLQTIRRAPIRKGDGTVGATAMTLEPTQVPDILDTAYQSSRKELLIKAGYRAVLTVPLLREDRIIGALSVSRKTAGPFAPEIVEVLKTFATQSAMAIQNARLFREIAEKGKQLEEASKHKSQFLASMSHELRTPLNAILGFNEMLLGEVYGPLPDDTKPPLAQMQTSGKHLLRLINNVLDLAKIEAGRMELALSDYSVHDTVESVRATLRPLAEAKGLDLRVEMPAELPLAHGDAGRITQCLMNLAGNSLKFTKEGKVEISVAEKNGLLVYRVADTGIGIPADKIGNLFTEFKQTDATIASEYGGTGLGLSISKKFIEMHGGRIWAESAPGQGATFIFEIPVRAGEEKTA